MTGSPLIFARVAALAVAFARLAVIGSRDVWRRRPRVPGDPETVVVRVQRGKHNALEGARIDVELPGRFDFSLRRENVIDRFAKVVGISREWQTGDRPFDGRVYITCDDPVLLETLSTHAPLRAILFRVLSGEKRSIYASNGRLCVQCGPEGESRDSTNELLQTNFARAFGADLHALRDHIAPLAGSDHDSPRDVAAAPGRQIATVSFALAILGLAGAVYDYFQHDNQVLREHIERLSAWSAGVAAAALLAVFFVKLRGTSAAHRALFDILLAAIPGAWLASAGILIFCNQHFDSMPPVRYGLRVDGAHTTKHKSRTHYHLTVSSWPTPGGDRTVEVGQAVYETLRPGGCVDVLWQRGRLGDGWVAGFEPNLTDDCERTFVE